MSGMVSYLAGMSAEEAVASDYVRRGHAVAARRWRGSGGELDLVFRDGDGLIVVEVKKARDFARAAARLSRTQLDRIYGAVSEFVAGEPRGQLTEVRFDLALVDGTGRVQIMENVWA
jgi:putative endonuclease